MENIPVELKAEFISWFCSKYKFKHHVCTWILNHFLSNKELLPRVHFVEDASQYDNGILIVTQCSKSVYNFTLYKKETMVKDTEKAFYYIRSNREYHYYIQLSFHQPLMCTPFLDVLESPKKEIKKVVISEATESFLEYTLYDFKVKQLKRQIDHSLIQNQKESFYHLSHKYNEALKQKPVQKFEIIPSPR
jgi:uncharacterized protein YpiB (UPF0302 family)